MFSQAKSLKKVEALQKGPPLRFGYDDFSSPSEEILVRSRRR